jgi:hypothetical protein
MIQLFSRKKARPGLLIALVATVLLTCFGRADQKSEPAFHLDLRQFGYLSDEAHGSRGDYSGVVFLSDSTLLVFVNQRIFHGSFSGPDILDEPSSNFVVFDLSNGKVVRTAELPLLKSEHSVAAAGSDQFAVATVSDVRLCSIDLHCDGEFHSSGPVFSSPSGTRLIVGGYGQTQQVLLDAGSLKPIQSVGTPLRIKGMPGDSGMLLQDNSTDRVKTQDGDVVLPLKDYGLWPSSRFISDKLVVGFYPDKKFAVVGTDGVLHYALRLDGDPWKSGFITSAGGLRFAVNAGGYSRFKSTVDLFHREGPPDVQRITVVDNQSGNVIFSQVWHPGAFFTLPALSPSGRRLAVIHQGILDVFNLM